MDYYYWFPIIVLLILAMASRDRGTGITHEILVHMSFREKLAFYGLATGVGIAIAVLGLGVAGLVFLALPHSSALQSLNVSGIILLPFLILAFVYLRKPVRRYWRRFLLQTRWARDKGITEGQIQL
jgi:hypothetical protein